MTRLLTLALLVACPGTAGKDDANGADDTATCAPWSQEQRLELLAARCAWEESCSEPAADCYERWEPLYLGEGYPYDQFIFDSCKAEGCASFYEEHPECLGDLGEDEACEHLFTQLDSR